MRMIDAVISEKGEPMKGLSNNEDAVKVLHNLKDSLSNRICEIYNMGYKEGFADGQRDAMQRLMDRVLAEGSADEHNTERD